DTITYWLEDHHSQNHIQNIENTCHPRFCPISLWKTSRPATLTLFPYTTLFRSNRTYFSMGGSPPASAISRINPLVLLNSCIFLRSEEHTSELQSRFEIVCRLLLE